MLPASSFLSPGSETIREIPPPNGFRPLELPLRNVSFAISAEFQRLRGNTTAREAGLRYESQAQLHLREVLGANYVAIELDVTDFKLQKRRLIPDGVFLHPQFSILFEVKSQHMPEAWWQLRKLYQPAMEFKRPGKPCYVVEVCRSFDPAMPFPEQVELIQDLSEYKKSPKPSFGVYQWK